MEILMFILLLVLSLAVISLFDMYSTIRDKHNILVNCVTELAIKSSTNRKIIFRQADEIAELRKELNKYEKKKTKKN